MSLISRFSERKMSLIEIEEVIGPRIVGTCVVHKLLIH